MQELHWHPGGVRGAHAAGEQTGEQVPSDVAKNQTPIVWPASRAGANFVTALNPTGLRKSSPSVCSR